MQKLPKIGLPIIILAFVLIVFVSKSSINIGYGEAGVLFKTFSGGVVTEQPPLGEGYNPSSGVLNLPSLRVFT